MPETTHITTHESASHVTIPLNHSKLLSFDPSSISIFLRNYDAYVQTVITRAEQVCFGEPSSSSSPTADVILPVDLKYCVDVEILSASIALGFIPDTTDVNDLTDKALREYLDQEATESRDAVSPSSLDDLVSTELKMDMTNRNARSVSYTHLTLPTILLV